MAEVQLKPRVINIIGVKNKYGEFVIDNVINGKHYNQNIFVPDCYVLCFDTNMEEFYITPLNLNNSNDIIVVPL